MRKFTNNGPSNILDPKTGVRDRASTNGKSDSYLNGSSYFRKLKGFVPPVTAHVDNNDSDDLLFGKNTLYRDLDTFICSVGTDDNEEEEEEEEEEEGNNDDEEEEEEEEKSKGAFKKGSSHQNVTKSNNTNSSALNGRLQFPPSQLQHQSRPQTQLQPQSQTQIQLQSQQKQAPPPPRTRSFDPYQPPLTMLSAPPTDAGTVMKQKTPAITNMEYHAHPWEFGSSPLFGATKETMERKRKRTLLLETEKTLANRRSKRFKSSNRVNSFDEGEENERSTNPLDEEEQDLDEMDEVDSDMEEVLESCRLEKEKSLEIKRTESFYKALSEDPFSLANLGTLGAAEPILNATQGMDNIKVALASSNNGVEERYYCYLIARRFNQCIRKPYNKSLERKVLELERKARRQAELESEQRHLLSLSFNHNDDDNDGDNNGKNKTESQRTFKKAKKLRRKKAKKWYQDEIMAYRKGILDPVKDRQEMAMGMKNVFVKIMEDCLMFKKAGEVYPDGREIWKPDPINFKIAKEALKEYRDLTTFKPESSPYTNKTAALHLGYKTTSSIKFDPNSNSLCTSNSMLSSSSSDSSSTTMSLEVVTKKSSARSVFSSDVSSPSSGVLYPLRGNTNFLKPASAAAQKTLSPKAPTAATSFNNSKANAAMTPSKTTAASKKIRTKQVGSEKFKPPASTKTDTEMSAADVKRQYQSQFYY